MVMTPAEFDTRRRTLGLSVAELADVCGVQDRTARRWCLGTLDRPADAVGALDALEAAMNRAVVEAVALVTERVADGPVVLWRHRTPEAHARSRPAGSIPHGAHAILIARVAAALAAEGVEAVIEWSDPAERAVE
jgi:hypothetical protein